MQSWKVGSAYFGQGPVPDLMGIVNCTPDSFFDGGKYVSTQAAVEHALRLWSEGARILDIGGESSRPNAIAVSVQEELDRVIPVIRELVKRSESAHFVLSIDTVKAEVASAAIDAGVQVVNDISMLQYDQKMAPLIAKTGVSVVLNHIRGQGRTMDSNPKYDDVIGEISKELTDAAHSLEALGVDPSKICLDPGVGFGKRLEDNYAIIELASRFQSLGYPLLYGMSRKSYIGKTVGLEKSDRLIPSVVSALKVAQQGVGILRVHDVAATQEALFMWKALNSL